MAYPWIALGGDGLHIWRVTATTLNEHLWTTDKEWSSILGVEWGLTTSHH